MDKKNILKEFQTLPGVGKSIAEDLWNMGFRSIDDLKHKDPEKLYEQLNKLMGTTIDRCMLYTFRCITYFVNETKHDPEKLKWWNWAGDRRSRPPASKARQGRKDKNLMEKNK